jgi:hypothetical protein
MERENWCMLGMVGITHKLTQAHRPTGFASSPFPPSHPPPPRTNSPYLFRYYPGVSFLQVAYRVFQLPLPVAPLLLRAVHARPHGR